MWWSSPSIFLMYFTCFWDHDNIISSPLSSLSTLPYIPSCSLSNSWTLFSLIVATCICVCLYMYTNEYICHIYIHNPNYILLSLLMLVVCMFSGLAIWYCITNWCVLPWGRLLLPESVLIAYSSLYRIEAHDLSPIHIGSIEALWSLAIQISMSTFVFVQVEFRQSCWWDFMDVASDVTRK